MVVARRKDSSVWDLPHEKCQTRREAGTESLRASRCPASRTAPTDEERRLGCRKGQNNMVKLPFRVGLVVAVLLFASVEAHAQYRRGNAITEAVAKTRMGVITLKVTKDSPYGGKKTIAGAGFVVDERGYVVTNHHVIVDASRIVVTLGDKSEVEATIHKELAKFDLAILR